MGKNEWQANVKIEDKTLTVQLDTGRPAEKEGGRGGGGNLPHAPTKGRSPKRRSEADI